MPRNIDGANIGTKAGIAWTTRNIDRLHRMEDLAVTMAPLFNDSIVYFRDDFLGDTLNTDHWVVTADVGSTAFASPSPNTAGGVISGTVSATSGEYISIYGPPLVTGDKGGGMFIRWKVDDIADVKLEMGLTDPLTDYTLPAINDIDTPSITNGASTVAILVRDTGQTLADFAFVTDGDATYTTGKTNLTTLTDPVADTWYKTVIWLDGDTANLAVYDDTDATSPVLKDFISRAAAVEGGTAVQPWFIYGNTTTDGGIATIDYMGYWVSR